MPEDILAKTAPRGHFTPSKFSALGIILAIILAIVLVLLGERLIFDLNRWVNPLITEITEQYSYDLGTQTGAYIDDMSEFKVSQSVGLSAEKNVLAPGISVYYPARESGVYLAYKLLIHAAFTIPVFLLVFLLYYLVKIKEQKEGWQAVIYAFMIFAFWMIIHLIGEAVSYTFSQYKSAAIYIILGVLVLILTPLAIFLQKKHSERTA